MSSSGRFLLLLVIGFAPAAAKSAEQLVIRVEAQGWGDADPENIRKVLESTGRELLKNIPPIRPIHIRVIPSGGAPQVDFRRGPNGEFTVRLAVKDRQWAQFAYQFGHELGHIVSHHERRHDNRIGNENLWFEETVCEAASLFVLAKMAETWKTTPPYSNWKSYAPRLGDYAARRIKDTDAPPAERMPVWFDGTRAALRADPYLRERNNVLAVHLSRMLEREPERWEAFRYLNLGRPDANNSFEHYLENWYFSTPRDHKPFVKGVVDLLGVKSKLIADHAAR